MPPGNVYHPVNAFTPEDKDALAAKITDIYARFMPRIYVNVLFHPIAEDSFYVGGLRRRNFVRISMDHIARAYQSEESSRRFIDKANQVLAPWVKDRGFDWEFHIDETPFALWSVQSYYPPKEGSEDERRWMESLIRLNIVSLTRLSHAALAGFRERGTGTLINIDSIIAFSPSKSGAVYSGSKAYVLDFIRSLQMEYADIWTGLEGQRTRYMAQLMAGSVAPRYLAAMPP